MGNKIAGLALCVAAGNITALVFLGEVTPLMLITAACLFAAGAASLETRN